MCFTTESPSTIYTTYTPTTTATPTTYTTIVPTTNTTMYTPSTTTPSYITTPITNTAPPTSVTPFKKCEEGFMELGDDSPYFGPSDNESSKQETDNVFTNPRGQINVTLTFNANQVAESNLETLIFDTKRVGFDAAQVITKSPDSPYAVKVDTALINN